MIPRAWYLYGDFRKVVKWYGLCTYLTWVRKGGKIMRVYWVVFSIYNGVEIVASSRKLARAVLKQQYGESYPDAKLESKSEKLKDGHVFEYGD